MRTILYPLLHPILGPVLRPVLRYLALATIFTVQLSCVLRKDRKYRAETPPGQ